MASFTTRFLILAGGMVATCCQLQAQALVHVDPGLESAVKWKWRVVPSNPSAWGLPIPEIAPPPVAPQVGQPSAPGPAAPLNIGDTYVVKSGDRLVFIAKHLGRTVNQLKTFNGLTTDLIKVGQVLKVPTIAEARAIEPFPTPQVKTPGGKGKAPAKRNAPDDLALKVFLDRELFTAGPIDDKSSLLFGKVLQLYQSGHPDAADLDVLKKKAQVAVNDGLATYTIKPEDFRFIAPPKAAISDAKSKSGKAHPEASALKYQELTSATMLAYQTPWEFVAERFHCDEAFLRHLNGQIKKVPSAGTELIVPNVIPFEIERALVEPLQPRADPTNPVGTAITNMELFVIYRGGAPIAAMPISSARPGLKGKGTWTILRALPRPRLATLREPKEQAAPPQALFGAKNPEATPTPAKPILTTEEYLPPGPNNPVGVIWINLAKAGSPETLPYGLHGTNVPEKMTTTESLGGFRMTNWDIARAVHLLPPETPLEWKQLTAATPAAAPAQAAPAR